MSAIEVGVIAGKGVEGARRDPAVAQLLARILLEAAYVRPLAAPPPNPSLWTLILDGQRRAGESKKHLLTNGGTKGALPHCEKPDCNSQT